MKIFFVIVILLCAFVSEVRGTDWRGVGSLLKPYSCWTPSSFVKSWPHDWQVEGIAGHEIHWRPYTPHLEQEWGWKIHRADYIGCAGEVRVHTGMNEFRWRFVYEDGSFSPFSDTRIVEYIGAADSFVAGSLYDAVPAVPEVPRNVRLIFN